MIDAFYNDMLQELSPGQCKTLDPTADRQDTDSLGLLNSIPLFIVVFVMYGVGGIVHVSEWWWRRTKKLKEEEKAARQRAKAQAAGKMEYADSETGADGGNMSWRRSDTLSTDSSLVNLRMFSSVETSTGSGVPPGDAHAVMGMLQGLVQSQADSKRHLSELSAQMVELSSEIKQLKSG